MFAAFVQDRPDDYHWVLSVMQSELINPGRKETVRDKGFGYDADVGVIPATAEVDISV
jgi:hypothetical protein